MISKADKDSIISIAKKYNVSKVLLFGSSASNEKEGHDIDLAVDGIIPSDFFAFYSDLIFGLTKPVDLIDLPKHPDFTEWLQPKEFRFMADIEEKIAAEIENIEKAFKELHRIEDLSKISNLELAGIGALLHNFYNSIENIIKQIFIFKSIIVPSGSFWHKDLLEAACLSKVITSSTKEKLGPFLAFRHYFVHGYALDLKADRIFPLVKSSTDVFNEFKKDLFKQGFEVISMDGNELAH